MVAVDDAKRPVAVPSFVPQTPDEVRRHASAELRRGLRQEFRARFDAVRRDIPDIDAGG